MNDRDRKASPFQGRPVRVELHAALLPALRSIPPRFQWAFPGGDEAAERLKRERIREWSRVRGELMGAFEAGRNVVLLGPKPQVGKTSSACVVLRYVIERGTFDALPEDVRRELQGLGPALGPGERPAYDLATVSAGASWTSVAGLRIRSGMRTLSGVTLDRNPPPNEWFLEKDGRRYARLRGTWGSAEMFWQTFTVIPETDDPALLAELWSRPWWHACGHTYVCAFSGLRTENAFAGGVTPTPEAPLVSIRSLYLHDDARSRDVLSWRGRLRLWARRTLAYLAR